MAEVDLNIVRQNPNMARQIHNLTPEEKQLLVEWVRDINRESEDHFCLSDDKDKRDEIRAFMKNDVVTVEDLDKWFDLIVDLDVVDVTLVSWKRLLLISRLHSKPQ
jgi:hypothetical protein